MKIVGSFPKTRLRRLRKAKWIRDLISENNISNKDLIMPIFVRDGKNHIDSILRVYHAGEAAAAKIYDGQLGA